MNPQLLEFIKIVAPPLMAAFLAAGLAVRRTKSETRWQAKYDSYQNILKAVEDIRYWAEVTYSDAAMLPSPGGDHMKAASARYHEAKRSLSSYVHVGALLICADARAGLEEMLSAIAREEYRYEDEANDPSTFDSDLVEHCDKLRNIIAVHLPPLLQLIKTDLR